MIRYDPEKLRNITIVNERDGDKTIDFVRSQGIWWLLKENKLLHRPVTETEKTMLEAMLEMVNYYD